MAYEVNAYGARVKVRTPLGVFGLGLITLGIYWVVWYYKINREMRDFGRVYQDQELADSNPTNSVLAVTLGALIIVPAIISYYRTVGRIRRVQRIGQVELTSGWLVLIMYFVVGFVIPSYLQYGLNELWNRYPRVDGDQAAIAPGDAGQAQPQPPVATEAELSAAPPPSATSSEAPPPPSE